MSAVKATHVEGPVGPSLLCARGTAKERMTTAIATTSIVLLFNLVASALMMYYTPACSRMNLASSSASGVPSPSSPASIPPRSSRDRF